MSKDNNENFDLSEALEDLKGLVNWFEDQDEVDVEAGLDKVKKGADLIKKSKSRLSEIENEFEEVKEEIEDEDL